MRNRHQIKLTLKKYSFINQMLHNDRILTEQNYLIKLIQLTNKKFIYHYQANMKFDTNKNVTIIRNIYN